MHLYNGSYDLIIISPPSTPRILSLLISFSPELEPLFKKLYPTYSFVPINSSSENVLAAFNKSVPKTNPSLNILVYPSFEHVERNKPEIMVLLFKNQTHYQLLKEYTTKVFPQIRDYVCTRSEVLTRALSPPNSAQKCTSGRNIFSYLNHLDALRKQLALALVFMMYLLSFLFLSSYSISSQKLINL